MSFAAIERKRLVRTLLDVGPDAPTLCEGWSTHHLATHLLIRETRPLATIGMFLPALSPVTERAMSRLLDRPYPEVVQRWGRGPHGPWRLVDAEANALEHFVHHEDVRRAAGFGPRNLSTPEESELYHALRAARWLFRPSRGVVELWPHGFFPIVAGRPSANERVQVHGSIGELVLFSYGRPAQELDFVGDEGLVGILSL